MSNYKDLTGQWFGNLEVVEMVKIGSLYHARCRCKCGKFKTFQPCNLRRGPVDCGCTPRARKPVATDLTGQQFGYLTVVAMEQVGKTQTGSTSGTYYAICKCSNCGNPSHPVLPAALRRGATTSCGCRRDQYLCNTGELSSNFKGYKEIRSRFWSGYERGAKSRGLEFSITIEYAWGLFEGQDRRCVFSGEPLIFGPTKKNSLTTASIDRIDSSKGYIPGNIQWVHKKVNVMRNAMSVGEFIAWCQRIANNSEYREVA